jgi:hypothetical protein
MIYKLYITNKEMGGVVPNAAMTVGVEPQISFLFDPANTDYQEFLRYKEAGGKVYEADEEVPVNG